MRRIQRYMERRQLRDAQNPFHLPRDKFINYFRLTPEIVIEIATELRADLRNTRLTGLAPEIKVLIAIQFYAQGSYQRSVGNQVFWTVSQPTTSRCLHAVTEAINRQQARAKFSVAAYQFEGAIGAIDCTFIHIIGPRENEEAFVNHHGRHSLNVQTIVDPEMKILNINPRYPGARNDAYIWSTSPIRRVMEFHYNRGERKTWLIGDAGYPLEPWLMMPLADFPEDTRQFQYTQKLCKARNVVERFFGVFKSVWRCCSYQRVLMYEPVFAAKIVNACAVLHNIRIRHRLHLEEFEAPIAANNPQNENAGANEINEDVIQRGPRALAQRIQRQIMRERFPNYRDAQAEGD
ncbi:PREDICTED: putative nuclease HARBI1 [Cyphomyrmex costatus]|uniref:putative nuclease HARBI1 n=1 Tax=Cyphomyrmex costatus TaxID=456900 RepID=UPI00085232AC|nr:PREDICTED: putative nuclease HARBI1 [Cyphomyrmex costatus]